MKKISSLGLILLLTLLITIPETMAYQKPLKEAEEKIPIRIGILYDDRSDLSITASRYIKWLFNTMWKIPTELINTHETEITKQLFFDESTPRYSIIFLTNIMDGVNRLSISEWHTIIEEVNNAIPIVTGLYAIRISQANELFGCITPIDKFVKQVTVASNPLVADLQETTPLWRDSVISTLNGGEALMWDTENGKDKGALLVMKGMNLWFGLKDFTRPSPTAGPLTIILNNNPFTYMKLWLLFTQSASIHCLTIIAFTTNYIINLYLTNYLIVPWRVTISLATTMLGLILYDLIWIIYFTIYNHPVFFLPQTALLTLTILIHITLNQHFHHIQIHTISFLFTFTTLIYYMTILAHENFFTLITLYEQGLAPDPHNLTWFIGKLSATYLGTTTIKWRQQQ